MRGRLLAVLVVALVALTGAASAQAPDTTALPDTEAADELEALLEDEASGDPTVLLELLAELRETPLDVNAATADELAQIPALDPLLAAAIVRQRTEAGLFGSLPEIQTVPGLTPEVFLAARPYLTIGEVLDVTAASAPRFPTAPTASAVLRGLTPRVTQRLQRRLNTAEGFQGPDSLRTFPGSRDRIYTRLQATYRRQVSLNLTLEKDPGEAFRWDPETNTYGYDYASAHAALLDAGRIDALVLGDFVAEYGQGLALWRAAGFGKGPDAVGGPIRNGRGIRPYGSVDENQFFRGAALAVSLTPNLVASGFASRRTLDASLFVPDSLDLADPDIPPGALDGAIVTGLSVDGLHRTERELERKDAIGETLLGGGVEYRRTSNRLEARVGIVGYRATFDAPLGAGDRPDEQFDFSGDEATMVSVYADAQVRGGQAFTEVARSPGGAVGGLAGLLADLGGGADVLVVGRHFPRDFTTLHGYPFGERNGVGQNETGLYTGVRLRPSREWTVQAYFDQYRFPWLRFSTPRPTTGHEALVFVEHRPRRWIRVYLQARTETRERDLDVIGAIPTTVLEGVAPETRQTLRVQGEWAANRGLRFRARAEVVRFAPREDDEPTQTGGLLFNDVRIQVTDGLRLDARLTLFSTDSFDSRLYTYENDLSGVFAVPVLYGRGSRAYALVTAEPLDGIQVQAKLGTSLFRDRRSLGTGANRIEGSRVADLGIQIRARL
ncbi:MAG: helix-hairpin-helix domain-containing protein [Bacteroidota bacterium]